MSCAAVAAAATLARLARRHYRAFRHCTLPFVCRRWRELCHAPVLLRQLSIEILDDEVRGHPSFPARVLSLCAWLRQRAAGHVERLELKLSRPYRDMGGDDEEAAAVEDDEAQALVEGAVLACAARLTELSLEVCWELHVGRWLKPCSRLRVASSDYTFVYSSLAGLAALRELEIGGYGQRQRKHLLEWADKARLPPTLERLSIDFGNSTWPVPKQARQKQQHALACRSVTGHAMSPRCKHACMALTCFLLLKRCCMPLPLPPGHDPHRPAWPHLVERR